jgi:hypothetical protein
MKKPDALVQLLEDLQGESLRSEAETLKTSKAIIYLTDEYAREEDGVELSAKECVLLFSNPATVERMVDALDAPDATLALFDVNVPGHTLEALERSFVAVDEG